LPKSISDWFACGVASLVAAVADCGLGALPVTTIIATATHVLVKIIGRFFISRRRFAQGTCKKFPDLNGGFYDFLKN
jgi:hypothetical protein